MEHLHGGKMKVYEYALPNEELKYLQDKTAKWPYPDAISKMDENNLKKIARDIGGEYFHMTDDSSTSKVINSISNMVTYTDTNESVEVYSDTYYYFAIVLFVVLTVVLLDIKNRL